MIVERVISITAQDRPGLVEILSTVIADHGGNWVDSSMARLGGAFAGIVRVTVSDENIAGFDEAVLALSDQGLTVALQVDPAPPRLARPKARIDLAGEDRPGIVRRISSILASQGVSIDELHTQVFHGSMSGHPVFAAKGQLVLPHGIDLEALREEFEAIAEDIVVDLTLDAPL